MRPDLCQVNTQTNPADMLDKIYIDALVHDRIVAAGASQRLD